MKKICLLAAFALLLFSPAQTAGTLGQLTQLVGGTWKTQQPKNVICEQWKSIGDNELSGRSFKITGNDTINLEQVKLIKNGLSVFYIPTVNGQNNGQPVPFKLTSAFNGTYTFSNPEHDYPQVIVYQFVSKNELNAWIDGTIDGKQKRVNYHYKRVMD